ncbi:MAG: ADP-ribosylglycohydrolase family protein, partial [Clostridia bacterium]|nr:ADP-ribosylglycohydrolase family protein [Clostridia bacterium]
AVRELPMSEYKIKMGDIINEIVLNAKIREDYKYVEPSDYEGIQKELNKKIAFRKKKYPKSIKKNIKGAWYGRIAGCLLGKTVEGIRTDELIPLLKHSDNYPMHRYILSTDPTQEEIDNNKFKLGVRCYADKVNSMPADDDTNYMVLYQEVVKTYSRDFTPDNIAEFWPKKQPQNAYCTAERVAFNNFVKGYLPPMSAIDHNPFREWIGAQIRGDYFGYINPGDPKTAAEMAWRDACISHVKNGIYGEMFIAAMIAAAPVTKDIQDIIKAGLSQIPEKSRLYEAITKVIDAYNNGVTEEAFFADLHQRWNEFSGHDWCHTISNAEIVVACLLYGKEKYGRSICMAVEQGFDTDCNGATVGSILGMKNGFNTIEKEWLEPLHGKLDTAIFGIGQVKIDDRVELTMKHLV